MANLSSRAGLSPTDTRISLSNNAATSVQNFNGYDTQVLEGHVFIDATVNYRASVRVTIIKNGAGVYEVAATDIAGDDNAGNPIVSFSMSGSILQATLVSYAGFSSAYIQYHLVSPAQGLNFPLSVDASAIANVVGTVSESAGVPTGAIIESGSNANGEYIKYADGTMICYIRASNTSQAINNSYGSLYQGTWQWDYPLPFTAPPTVTLGESKWGTGASWGSVSVADSTHASLRVMDTASRGLGTLFVWSAIAIGRWY